MKASTKFYTQFELDGEEVAQAIDAFAFRQSHAAGGDSPALVRLLKGFREAHGKMVELGEVAAASDRGAALVAMPLPTTPPLTLPGMPKEATDGDG